ncbi:hypothetical protein BHM03_00001911 [Ensete ventricosum]|nr:hypothetical protein BHM03_00001911 [Ensete ventricosum]
MSRPNAPSTTIQAPAPKKLTRDELRERSAKELCWHCDKQWSREHHCKKGQLLIIEPVEDEDNETSEEALEPKEEAMEEESQPANYAVQALADYSNPLMIAPTKEPKLEDMTLEPKEKDTPQPATRTVILPKPCGTPVYPSVKVSLPRDLLESLRLTKEKTGQKKQFPRDPQTTAQANTS